MAIWKSWYSRPTVVPILAPTRVPPPDPPDGGTALFFSGGVDSLFSLYRNEQREPGDFPVDELIAIHGFDIPLENVEAFARHAVRLDAVAAATGKPLILARTNLRQTRLREAPWASSGMGARSPPSV